jgi:hypothetical protein
MRTKNSPAGRCLTLGAAILLAALVAAVPALGKDRNHDSIPDKWEKKHQLSLKHDQARRDQDSDALRNRGEFRTGMDPRDDDSDDDGVEDGDEGAGVIDSFDPESGRLVINVFNGDSVSGLVTDETEIECENDDLDDPGDGDADEPGDDGPGDDGGDGHGDDGPGDDGGGEPGDDEGDDGPGHERSDEGDGGGPDHAGEDDCDGEECTVDDLEPGRVVREAELDLTASGLVFGEIELK